MFDQSYIEMDCVVFGFYFQIAYCGINHRRQWSTLEQDNDAPQMLIYLMYPKWTQAMPSWPKRCQALCL